MRILLLLIANVFINSQARAQLNLVPNSSIEDTGSCPANPSGQFRNEIYKLINWLSAEQSLECLSSYAPINQYWSQVSVPLNGLSFS